MKTKTKTTPLAPQAALHVTILEPERVAAIHTIAKTNEILAKALLQSTTVCVENCTITNANVGIQLDAS